MEGLRFGYDEKVVEVITEQGKLNILMYFATRVNSSLKPYCWYKEHVLIGAREHGLPPEHIAQIEAIAAVEDPDVTRGERELAIYC